MLKMEKTCCSLKCDVLHGGELIGYMEGVYITQWFIKNKYLFKGSFNIFIQKSDENFNVGIIVDIIFPDKKLIARDAKVGGINSYGKNGTFEASKLDHYEYTINIS